jgi:hypothetical protein
VALEAFIQTLAASSDKPKPKFSPAGVRLGMVKPDRYLQESVQLTNDAPRGHLSGTIAIAPPVSWLTVRPLAFSGNNTPLELTVSTAGLAQGARLATDIVVTTPHAAPVSLSVRGRVEVAWVGFLTMLGLYVLLGALIGAGVSWLVGQGQGQLWAGNLKYYWLGAVVLIALAASFGMAKAARQPNDGIAASRALLGSLVMVLVAAYLMLVLQLEYQSIRAVYGARSAHLVVGGVILLAAFLLALFAGLRKLRRMTLAVFIPLLLLAGLTYWLIETERMEVAAEDYAVTTSSIPVYYVALHGREATTEVLPKILPTVPTAQVVRLTPTSRPASTKAPSATAGKATSAAKQPTATPGIKIGAKVKVANTGGVGLGIRSQPGTSQPKRGAVKDNTVLDVIGGPQTADGMRWWQVRSGKLLGWASEKYLVLVK